MSRAAHSGRCGWESQRALKGNKSREQGETLMLIPGIILVRGINWRPQQNLQLVYGLKCPSYLTVSFGVSEKKKTSSSGGSQKNEVSPLPQHALKNIHFYTDSYAPATTAVLLCSAVDGSRRAGTGELQSELSTKQGGRDTECKGERTPRGESGMYI